MTMHNNALPYAECRYAECHVLFTTMLSGIMLNVIMLSGIMLNVVMLSVVAPKNKLRWFLKAQNDTQCNDVKNKQQSAQWRLN
jgi:hypothetical protein